MEVILLERVGRIGKMGETVNVKNGFARNFLLPRGKALRANEANKKKFEAQRAELEKRNEEAKAEAAKTGKKIDGKTFIVIRQASETGQLYGSVTSRDIAELASTEKDKVERTQVQLNAPLKIIGMHKVVIQPHPEVDITVTINIARSADEAKRQEKGEDLTKRRSDDDEQKAQAALNAEALFENAPSENGDEADTDNASAA